MILKAYEYLQRFGGVPRPSRSGKIFYFLGPQTNIENFLQVLKLIDTWILPLHDTNKLLNWLPCNILPTEKKFSVK